MHAPWDHGQIATATQILIQVIMRHTNIKPNEYYQVTFIYKFEIASQTCKDGNGLHNTMEANNDKLEFKFSHLISVQMSHMPNQI